MSLGTVISARQSNPTHPSHGLVLMGGGARCAYQVGVLQAVAHLCRLHPELPQKFPFQILVGSSAGALNAACLASYASEGLAAFDRLAQFWLQLRSQEVYRLNLSLPARYSRLWAAVSLSNYARSHGAALDNMPLVDSLHHAVSLPGIEQALQDQTLTALAVTASSYSSGVHWTFCHTAQYLSTPRWSRPGRRAEFQPISIEHLMASSAIPFIFPATPLWVDGRREFFGDGSMRQVSPLSPALHLGAHKVLAIGASQPEHLPALGASNEFSARSPSLGGIAGHAMASVFHDTLRADVEQAQRISRTMRQLAPEVAAVLPYRAVEVLAISPSQSLDALAAQHAVDLPRSTRHILGGLGALRGGGAALASYLLFEPGFVQALMRLGQADTYAQKSQVLAFFTGPLSAAWRRVKGGNG